MYPFLNGCNYLSFVNGLTNTYLCFGSGTGGSHKSGVNVGGRFLCDANSSISFELF